MDFNIYFIWNHEIETHHLMIIFCWSLSLVVDARKDALFCVFRHSRFQIVSRNIQSRFESMWWRKKMKKSFSCRAVEYGTLITCTLHYRVAYKVVSIITTTFSQFSQTPKKNTLTNYVVHHSYFILLQQSYFIRWSQLNRLKTADVCQCIDTLSIQNSFWRILSRCCLFSVYIQRASSGGIRWESDFVASFRLLFHISPLPSLNYSPPLDGCEVSGSQWEKRRGFNYSLGAIVPIGRVYPLFQ